MQNSSWHIGDVVIHKITEMVLTPQSGVMSRLIPDATSQRLDELEWLAPHFVDEDGRMVGSIHALVVTTPGKTIVIDTCVGNDKQRRNADFHGLQTDFLSDLRAIGVDPDSVDIVLCTHLHIDHVGWNTKLEQGRWVPTFPNARYLFGEKEYQHWSRPDHGALERLDVEAVLADSVQPIIDAGLAELVATDQRVCREVRLIPTPGHTPGHVSVLIESRGESALITGDFLHHPCQFAHPEWPSSPDSDPEKNHATRLDMYQRFADSPTLIIGTHFAGPSAGLLRQAGKHYRFDV
jgi:glyoxylase-like metal-dependent hydrolase (beta-lactamase superfamily II)